MNEAGAKAMSFTKVGADSVSAPVDNVEFTVDRPFLYSYVTPDGIPLFIGAVRTSAESVEKTDTFLAVRQLGCIV